jgi:hypothetical protein
MEQKKLELEILEKKIENVKNDIDKLKKFYLEDNPK